MILAIDIGNSRTKCGIFDSGELVSKSVFTNSELSSGLDGILSSLRGKKIYAGIVNVSSTSNDKIISLLKDSIFHFIGPDTPVPILNHYKSPETLGPDRIIVAVAALAQAGSGPLLVFDAGTALTWEAVDASGAYVGGGITPGINMRLEALHQFTARLPRVEFNQQIPPLAGYDTPTSILSGVVNGVIAEINGITETFRQKWGSGTRIFLTGGDADFLAVHVKSLNFADPDLLLKGIDKIIRHNYPNA